MSRKTMPGHEPPIDRRGTSSEKWEKYAGRDVLPLWVADMDLPTAPFVLDAVRERLEHPILGYTAPPARMAEGFRAWLRRRYGWRVDEEWLVWIPGGVPGFNVAARAVATKGHDLVIPAPVYGPILKVPDNVGLRGVVSSLALNHGRWEMDGDDLGAKMSAATAAILFCNPQNPSGRVYDRDELEAVAELTLRNDAVLISDEIHCPIVLDETKRHVPIASLGREVEARSISLFSPTKAFNFPGLNAAVAVIPDPVLRERYELAGTGLISVHSPLAFAALTAAFEDDSGWLDEQNAFLAGNARRLEVAITDIDGIRTTPVEGTYLAWLDVSALGLEDAAAAFEEHGLGLHGGEEFGDPGFLRLNFGCPRSILDQAVDRLAKAAEELAAKPV
ncbi:MAG: PatB family C-S lyase [Gammaproteobacteria bacterium]|nr:PatB family C-S lyase [Gammaproteobacteria bacterium]